MFKPDIYVCCQAQLERLEISGGDAALTVLGWNGRLILQRVKQRVSCSLSRLKVFNVWICLLSRLSAVCECKCAGGVNAEGPTVINSTGWLCYYPVKHC